MRKIIFALIGLIISSFVFAGPAPYGDAKIYILDRISFDLNPPATPEYIRKNADIVMSLGIHAVDFWYDLDWENAKYDPEIKNKAKPLVMVIDFYDRVQPIPPEKPSFETLYCSDKYAYSDDGHYIDISRFAATTLKFPLKRK